MYAASIINIAIIALATAVSARPYIATRAAQATRQDFEITKFVLSDIIAANTTLTFNVYDPDPLTNETATCTATWKHNSTDYPQGPYEQCGDSDFAWHIENYVNLQNFTIGLDHSFVDPSVGDPPYDHVTNFGRATINSTVISPQDGGANLTYKQIVDIIYADIYATIA